MEDLTGMQLGPYRIVAPLGEGGMATVYKAYQPGMDRYVAVKILPRQLAQDAQYVGRFKQEARLIARLVHPHILPIHDFGEAEGYTYLVMPYIEGGTLRDLLAGRPLPLSQILTIMTQLADALDHAHSLGIVHRDLKPSNVLMDQRGNCLLTDFGIDRMVEGATQYTQTGSTVGTPAYMSPEQGRGEKVDQRSDLYSLGVMLYELATGRVPFDAETPVAVIFKHIQDPLPPPRKLNPELPEGVERVIFKALAKPAADRYATAAEMAAALRAAIGATVLGASSRAPSDVTTLGPSPASEIAPGDTATVADTGLQPLPAAQKATVRVAPSAPGNRRPRAVLVVGGLALLVMLIAGGGTAAYLGAKAMAARRTAEAGATPTVEATRGTPAGATAAPPTARPALDLTARPLVWFAPLPPLPTNPTRPFVGSDDFMGLFAADAPWAQAASHIQVFKLYGEWVAWHATFDELQHVVAALKSRSIAIAVEAGPLEPGPQCGEGIEGFAGIAEGTRIAKRIKNAGGTLTFVALDQPFAGAGLWTGPNACRWPADKIAAEIVKYEAAVREVFPDVVFGDTEVLWADTDVGDLKRWIDTYAAVTGQPLPFLHLDIDFGRPDWPQVAGDLEAYARERGIPFGVIYTGNWHDRTDEAWLASAGERIKTYEIARGGRPDHVVFQSWHDHPDRLLPETQAGTFTALINAYFQGKAALGIRTQGPGANLSFGKPVTASQFAPGLEPSRAVDANPETWWGAEAPPTQWIEVDLGGAYPVAEINLLTGQSPSGLTEHTVSVKGPATGDQYVRVHTFFGTTTDLQWLQVPLAGPVDGIRFVRIETTKSPSWVSWREIEVIAPK